MGGNALCVLEVYSKEVATEIISVLFAHRIPVKFLGNGSNVVFPDYGISNILLFKYVDKATYSLVEESDNYALFSVHSGTSLIGLSRELSQKGYSGLEFAAGIPATIGGAVKMNAGAHGESMSNIVTSASIISPENGFVDYDTNALSFSYRHSQISDNQFICSAMIHLTKDDPEKIRKKRTDALSHRRATQPLHMPSSGSVFKNPSADCTAGYLIESAGMKGYLYNGMKISDLHANWIVKHDSSGTAGQFRDLVQIIKEKVFLIHKIELNEEIIFW